MAWFTFSYNNISRWVEECVVCGKKYKREELNKHGCCKECKKWLDMPLWDKEDKELLP